MTGAAAMGAVAPSPAVLRSLVVVLAILAITAGALLAAVAAGRRAAVRRRFGWTEPGHHSPYHRRRRRSEPVVALAAARRRLESALGRVVRRIARRPPDPSADQRLGRAVGLALVVVVCGLGPVPAVALGFAAWAGPLAARRRRRVRRQAAIGDETPEVVDLIRLGVGSGLNVRLALDAVVRHHDGVVAAELRDVLARADRGDRLADALDTVGPGADPLRPLIDALVASERYGAPLTVALDRVADDARTTRRRRREEAARRVPVKLLFPLVFCTLPAFVLLTVVPVLLRSLPSLAP